MVKFEKLDENDYMVEEDVMKSYRNEFQKEDGFLVLKDNTLVFINIHSGRSSNYFDDYDRIFECSLMKGSNINAAAEFIIENIKVYKDKYELEYELKKYIEYFENGWHCGIVEEDDEGWEEEDIGKIYVCDGRDCFTI
jgi:hypothetical protein